jgi:hypothetical protein
MINSEKRLAVMAKPLFVTSNSIVIRTFTGPFSRIKKSHIRIGVYARVVVCWLIKVKVLLLNPNFANRSHP